VAAARGDAPTVVALPNRTGGTPVTRVLVAPDKFKGSLPATAVAAAVATGLRRAAADLEVVQNPVADGGDGTLEAALDAGYERVPVRVSGPLGDPVDTAYAVRDGTAVVEMADACGLVRMPAGRLEPLTASSTGLGEVVRTALDAGCPRVVVGIGGSASTDGGAGMLAALGARFLDADGVELPPGGGALARLDRVDLGRLHPRLDRTEVVLATDVDNPLLGARGAAAVYGPQKGADAADVEVLDAALARLSQVLGTATGVGDGGHPAALLPGAGAAGGVGFAALSVLGASARPGIELLLELTGFHDKLPGAALVITGEGSLDQQTLAGKAPVGVAAAARAHRVPVVAVAGRCLLDAAELADAGISAAYALTDLEPDPARCMTEAGPLLELLSERVGRDWLVSRDRAKDR
jgi:glycerate kinase